MEGLELECEEPQMKEATSRAELDMQKRRQDATVYNPPSATCNNWRALLREANVTPHGSCRIPVVLGVLQINKRGQAGPRSPMLSPTLSTREALLLLGFKGVASPLSNDEVLAGLHDDLLQAYAFDWAAA